MQILIAVSGSNDGSDPVSTAVSIPWPEGTVFRVLTVAENVHPPMVELIEGARDVSEVQHDADNTAANTAASAVARLQDRGFNANRVSREGDPKSIIADYAKEWRADRCGLFRQIPPGSVFRWQCISECGGARFMLGAGREDRRTAKIGSPDCTFNSLVRHPPGQVFSMNTAKCD